MNKNEKLTRILNELPDHQIDRKTLRQLIQSQLEITDRHTVYAWINFLIIEGFIQ